MDNFDEEVIVKSYDGKLMKRLLKYAKPYWKSILLCVLMLPLLTLIDLARPYLVKVAIDNYINGYNTPMAAYELGTAPSKGIVFNGRIFVRLKDSSKAPEGTDLYQIQEYRGHYYLVNGILRNGNKFTISPYNGDYLLKSGNVQYNARLLSGTELKLFRRNDARTLQNISFAYLLLVILAFAVNYAQTLILQYTGQNIIFNIREEIFTHIEGLSLSFFDKNPVGRLVTRVTNDVEALNEMYTEVLVNLFKDAFLLAGIIIVMLSLNMHLALISFTVIPIIIVSTIIFKKYDRNAYRSVRLKLARINSSLSENISGMKIVQIFHREDKKFNEFNGINNEYFTSAMKQLTAFAIFRPFIDLIASLALSLILYYGWGDVVSSRIELGVLFAFISYSQQFFQPIADLAEKFDILQSAMASSERIFMLLDNNTVIENPADPVIKDRLDGDIEFKNVWFAYNNDDWVLRDVSFNIKSGQTIAFVGATGAGKTSIISLMNRFYDIQKGSITIDGIDIRDMDKYTLRSSIGVVLQDVFLFTGDIKSNIRLSNNNISDENIKEISKYVNADKFISQLKGKYNEEVKERGSTLSSGQRQLLAFARALAFDPSILVLDEATSNIDTETEALIQDALQKLSRGRTTIIIAHRLSTIQNADKIIVLHKGRVRESGTHQELLDKKGIYYNLYQLQYKDR